MKGIFFNAVDFCLVILGIALLFRAEYDRETKPHWVKIMNGDRVISSYTTTNSEQVEYYGTNIVAADGQIKTVMRSRTNLLWTTYHLFR